MVVPFPRVSVKPIADPKSIHAPSITCACMDYSLSSSKNKNAEAETKSNNKGNGNSNDSSSSSSSSSSIKALKMKRAWEVALSPAKSIFMTAFMLYMAGNSVQIFSILITAMTLMNPIKAIFQVNQAFSQFDSKSGGAETSNEIPQSTMAMIKGTFILCNLLTFGCGLYKLSGMGLLPTTSSDWLIFVEPRTFSNILL